MDRMLETVLHDIEYYANYWCHLEYVNPNGGCSHRSLTPHTLRSWQVRVLEVAKEHGDDLFKAFHELYFTGNTDKEFIQLDWEKVHFVYASAILDKIKNKVKKLSLKVSKNAFDYAKEEMHTFYNTGALKNLEVVTEKIGIPLKNVIAIYYYGSMVYGTFNVKSDSDFIVVNDCGINNQRKISVFNFNCYDVEEFQKALDQHKIFALECYFLPSNHVFFKRRKFEFKYDETLLRREISATASNSWVKCKKKLTVEENCEYIGKKSLFHSLRIIMFGIQIAKYGKIIDYGEANKYYDDIVNNECNDWEYFKEKYQLVYNSLMTDFRKLAKK